MRRIDGAGRTAEVSEDPFNERRLLDAGDDALPAAAVPAGLDVNGEHALEALHPGLPIRVSMVRFRPWPPLSNSMIRNGFRASPADHPWPSMVDPRTIGPRVWCHTARCRADHAQQSRYSMAH